MLRDLFEAEELIQFIKQRIKCEETYAFRLMELKSRQLGSNGFNQGQGGRVASVLFLKYKTEMGSLGLAHKQVAEMLSKLLPTLERYTQECRSKMTPRAEQIHTGWSKYSKSLQDTINLQNIASKKQTSLNSQQDELTNMGNFSLDEPGANNFQIGSKTITVDDFNDLIGSMQNEIAYEDIWRLLGSLKDCYSGEDLIQYLKNHSWSDSDADALLSYLLDQNYIKGINGRSNTFTASNHYQWKKLALEFDKEPTHKKAKRDANRAAFEANRSAKQLEILRLSIDIQIKEYMDLAQVVLTEHIKLIKDTLSGCLAFEKIPVETIKALEDRLGVFFESLDPDRELKSIIENERTGMRPVPTFVPLQLLPNTPAPIFGVPLEVYAARTNSKVPPIIRKCIAYLEDTFAIAETHTVSNNTQLDIWS